MIRGLGCDVCAVPRMREILEKPRFLERWFTEYERGYIAAHRNAAETAAGIFAAKEALAKALGTGFGSLMPEKISVRHDEKGAPYYELNAPLRAALTAVGAARVFLSISHDGGVAMAVAILEGDECGIS